MKQFKVCFYASTSPVYKPCSIKADPSSPTEEISSAKEQRYLLVDVNPDASWQPCKQRLKSALVIDRGVRRRGLSEERTGFRAAQTALPTIKGSENKAHPTVRLEGPGNFNDATRLSNTSISCYNIAPLWLSRVRVSSQSFRAAFSIKEKRKKKKKKKWSKRLWSYYVLSR